VQGPRRGSAARVALDAVGCPRAFERERPRPGRATHGASRAARRGRSRFLAAPLPDNDRDGARRHVVVVGSRVVLLVHPADEPGGRRSSGAHAARSRCERAAVRARTPLCAPTPPGRAREPGRPRTRRARPGSLGHPPRAPNARSGLPVVSRMLRRRHRGTRGVGGSDHRTIGAVDRVGSTGRTIRSIESRGARRAIPTRLSKPDQRIMDGLRPGPRRAGEAAGSGVASGPRPARHREDDAARPGFPPAPGRCRPKRVPGPRSSGRPR